MRHAVNIRQDQLHESGNAVRISRTSVPSAFRSLHSRVLLYAPRGEDTPGYYGTARVVGVQPDLRFAKSSWLELAQQRRFPRPITLEELYDDGTVNDMPFHTYSRTIRPVSKHELARISVLAGLEGHESPQFSEPNQGIIDALPTAPSRRLAPKIVRRSIVRFQMLECYGPSCAFTAEFHASLDGLRFAVQVGHLLPLSLDGPDSIQNVVPMSCRWLWDEGVFTMRSDGAPILSSRASSENRALLEKCEKIRFPEKFRYWPRPEYLEAHRDLVFEKSGR